MIKHEREMNPGRSVNKNLRSLGLLISAFPKLKKLGTGPLPKPTSVENPNYRGCQQDNDDSSDEKPMESKKSSVIVPQDVKSFEEFMSVYDSFCCSLVQSKSFLDRKMFTKAYYELEICITLMDTISRCNISDFRIDPEDLQVLTDLQQGVGEERNLLEKELKKRLELKTTREDFSIQDPPSYEDVLATDLLFSLRKTQSNKKVDGSVGNSSVEHQSIDSMRSANSQETIDHIESSPGISPDTVSSHYDILPTRVLPVTDLTSVTCQSTPSSERMSLESQYTPVYNRNRCISPVLPSSMSSREGTDDNTEVVGSSKNTLDTISRPRPAPRLSKINVPPTRTFDSLEDSCIYQNIMDLGFECLPSEAAQQNENSSILVPQLIPPPKPQRTESEFQGKESSTRTPRDREITPILGSSSGENKVVSEEPSTSVAEEESSGHRGFEDTLNELETGVIKIGSSKFYVKLEPDDYDTQSGSNGDWNLVLELKKPKIYFAVGDSVLSPARDNVYLYQGEIRRGQQVEMKMEISRSCIHRCNFQDDTVSLLTVTGYYIIQTGDTVIGLKASSRTKLTELEDFEDILKYKGIFVKERYCQNEENKTRKNDFTKSMSSLRDQAVLTTRRSLRSVRKLGFVKRFSANLSEPPPPLQSKPYAPPTVIMMKDETMMNMQKIARKIEENVHNETIEKI